MNVFNRHGLIRLTFPLPASNQMNGSVSSPSSATRNLSRRPPPTAFDARRHRLRIARARSPVLLLGLFCSYSHFQRFGTVTGPLTAVTLPLPALGRSIVAHLQ